MTANAILSFLEYLETEKGCSVSTRNARFAALRAFMDYAADHDVTLIAGLIAAGVALYKILIIIEFVNTDFPEPVVPATSNMWHFAISATTTLPAISLPAAKAIFEEFSF